VTHATPDRTIDLFIPYGHTARVRERLKKVTVNLPEQTLVNATRITGKGITPTIIEGLHELERKRNRSALRALKGRVRFELDLEKTRR